MIRARAAAVGAWLVAAGMLGSALGIGAVHTEVLVACAVFIVAGAAILWWTAEPALARSASTILGAAALALIAVTALQLVPLPHGVLGAVASANADVWDRALSPLQESGPSWAPLSLDPSATRVQVLRGVTYLAAFGAAVRIAKTTEGAIFLERAAAGSAALIALAALAHPVLGAHRVLGLYEPKSKTAFDPAHLSPLLNTNHLAAYANIGFAIAFASAIGRRPAVPRPIAIVIALLLAATTMWTASRGGIAAMALAAIMILGLSFWRRRGSSPIPLGRLALAVVGFAGAAMVLLAHFEATRAKFVTNDLMKLDVAKNALSLLKSFGLFGIGRGAFETVFPRVRVGTEYWVFTHPENVLLQWTTEWGVPVALAGMAALAAGLRPKTMLTRSRPPIGPWVAIVCVGLQNLVDFSSEIPGVMVALSVCAGTVAGGAGAPSAEGQRWGAWSLAPRRVAVALVVLAAAAIAASLPFVTTELGHDEQAIAAEALDPQLSREAFHASEREKMLHHPADAYLPYVGAVRAVLRHDESALPWAAAALERSPVYGRAHLMLARALFRRSPAQARLEYRMACIQDVALCSVDESEALVRDYDDALELVAPDQRGVDALEALATALHDRLPATVARIDEEILRRNPAAPGPLRRRAHALLHDLVDGADWCDGAARSACLDEAVKAARALEIAFPARCDGYALMADARALGGDPTTAFRELDQGTELVEDKSTCAREAVRLAQREKERARIDVAIDRLTRAPCEPTECVDNLLFAANAERARGNRQKALAYERKAADRAEDRDDLLAALAADAEAEHAYGVALEAFMKLADRHPGDPRWAEAVTRERGLVARGMFAPRVEPDGDR